MNALHFAHAASYKPTVSRGFTLVELAVVLIIVALLISGMMLPLSAQMDIRNVTETQKTLNDAREALMGFAMANERLPCPAASDSNGLEQFCKSDSGACETTTDVKAHGRCSSPYVGFLPAATLGISPSNAQGFAVDAWNNPIRYAVMHETIGTDFPFTAASTSGPPATGFKGSWSVAADLLRVCSTSTGISGPAPNTSCDAPARVTDRALAVIFTTGKNGTSVPTSADELANWTTSNDRTFVSRTPAPDFDDIVVWVSPNILYNRMITVGKLP